MNDFRCPKCGSRNVAADAYAVWDFKRQEWRLLTTYDNIKCLDCDYDSDSGFCVDLTREEGHQLIERLNKGE